MEKLLETSDKIFLIKLWGKFEENFQFPLTSHCLDYINMIRVVHQHSNFSSKFLYFFSQFKQEKKNSFSPNCFSFTFFFPSTFLSIKFSKDQTEPKYPIKSQMGYLFPPFLVVLNISLLLFGHECLTCYIKWKFSVIATYCIVCNYFIFFVGGMQVIHWACGSSPALIFLFSLV